MTATLQHLRPQDLLARNMEVENLVLGPPGLALRDDNLPGTLMTHPIEVPSGFDRATLSWNIRQPKGTDATVRFRIRGRQFGWSAWLGPGASRGGSLRRPDWEWEIDQVLTKLPCSHFQIELRIASSADAEASPFVKAVYFTSRNSRVFELACLNDIPTETPTIQGVPHLCQHEQDETRGSRLCSPTALAMVLQGCGIEADVRELADLCYDPDADLYGVWPRAIHAAYQKRALAWVEYIGNWNRAVHYLKRGIPLICSIAFRKEELEEPPYASTKGHLAVLLGIDSEGRPVTHDPNLPHEKGAFLKWKPKDFSRAWFGHGGMAYVVQGKAE